MSSPLAAFNRMAGCTALTAIAWLGNAAAQSPTVFNACITSLTGVFYEPRQPGTCFHHTHRAVSWTDGANAIRTGTTAGGDLGGTYPNPSVHALRGRPIADVAPAANQVLAWNGAAWAPADPSGGGGPSGAAGGDLTGTYPNPSIASGAVNSAKISDNTIDDADVVDNGLDATSLATGAVGSEEIGDGTVTTSDVAENSLTADDLGSNAVANDELAANAVTADKVASGQLVRSVNNVRDAVAVVGGSGINVATSGQTLTISATEAGGTTGQLAGAAYGTASLTVTPTSAFTLVPGLTQTISVPANSRVIITTDGGIQTTSAATTGYSIVDVAIFVDGSVPPNGGYRRIVAANTTGLVSTLSSWAMQVIMDLPAGTHTIQVLAAGAGGGGVNAAVSGSNTSVNQAALNVAVIKL